MASFIPLQSLLFHEVWVCLQHGNVLLNPLCQRLDRNYGISLFKNDMVWVIAFTLSAYWFREIVSMALCYQLVSPLTKQLILISSAYHAFKIVNVNIDAWRKWSPKLGILRLLLDYWHFDTVVNCIISFKRMFLQGFDTAVHGFIIYDIFNSTVHIPESSATLISPELFLVLAAGFIWIAHALVVQISRKSTATVMVELYRKIAVFIGFVDDSKGTTESTELPSVRESKHRHTNDKSKGTILEMFLGPHIHAIHKSSRDCKVCRMLSKPEKDTSSASSASVTGPSVVFLAHPMQLSSAFSLWTDKGKSKESYWRASWWMENLAVSSLVFFISAVVYPVGVLCLGSSPVVTVDRSSFSFKAEYCSPISSTEDSAVPIPSQSPTQHPTRSEVWFAKSFAWQFITPWTFWRGYAKEMVVRSALRAEKQGVSVIGLGALNKAHWLNNGGEDLVLELDSRRVASSDSESMAGYEGDGPLESGLLKEKALKRIKVVHGNTLTAAVVCHQLIGLLNEHTQAHQSTHSNNQPVKLMTVILVGATSKIGRAVALYMAATGGVRVVCVGAHSKRLDQIIEEGRISAQALGTENRITHCTDVLTASESDDEAVWLLGKGDRSTPLVDVIPFGATVLSFAVPCPLAVIQATGFWGRVKPSSAVGVETGMGMGNGGRSLMRSDVRYLDAGVMVLPSGMQAQRQFTLMLPNKLVYTCHAAALVHHLEGWEHHEVGEVTVQNMDSTLFAAHKHGFSVEPMPPMSVCTGSYNVRDRHGRTVDVTVLGCGPGGLASAACLMRDDRLRSGDITNATQHSPVCVDDKNLHHKAITNAHAHDLNYAEGGASRGLQIAMLDRHSDIEGQWLSQYQGLTLTSRGQHSALPYLPIPQCLFDTGLHVRSSHALNENNPATYKHGVRKRGQGELTAESYVRYLKMYARRHGLGSTMMLGCSVVKVCRADPGLSLPDLEACGASDRTDSASVSNGLWEVHYSYTNSSGIRELAVMQSRCVVVACGKAHVPVTDAALLTALKGFTGIVLNAKDVKDIAALSSSGHVLVVGSGNSALDLCSSLLKSRERRGEVERGERERDREEGGGGRVGGGEGMGMGWARRGGGGGSRSRSADDTESDTANVAGYAVHLSMRAVPPCIPRQWGPLAVEEMSVHLLQYLPVSLADLVVWAFYRILRTGGKGYTAKLPGGKSNPDWYPFSSRRVPPIDKGGFSLAVAEGRIVLHPCISCCVGKKITFKRNGAVKKGKEMQGIMLGEDGQKEDEDSLEAGAVVLCTGYRADWTLLLDSVSSLSSQPQHTDNEQSPTQIHTQTLDRHSMLSRLAHTRCVTPSLCVDGLFFIGYDPGDALIPLGAIRSQAKSIALYVQKIVRSAPIDR